MAPLGAVNRRAASTVLNAAACNGNATLAALHVGAISGVQVRSPCWDSSSIAEHFKLFQELAGPLCGSLNLR